MEIKEAMPAPDYVAPVHGRTTQDLYGIYALEVGYGRNIHGTREELARVKSAIGNFNRRNSEVRVTMQRRGDDAYYIHKSVRGSDNGNT